MKAKFSSAVLAVLLVILCLTSCELIHIHTEVIDEARAPTCAEVGLTEGKHCSVCNEVLVAQSYVKVLDHTVVIDEGKAPTCTESGLTEGKHCSVCNNVLVAQREIKANGHTIVIDEAKAPTGFSEGLTEGQHCWDCGEVLVAQQTISILPSTWIETSSGRITAGDSLITTDYLKLCIPANVYVPDDLVENINTVMSVMEIVSGLKFRANPNYDRGLVPVNVVKMTDTESELGPAYASYKEIVLSSGDLVDLFALIHEGSHVLQSHQSRWWYCILAMEGISTYTTYKTQEYIQLHYPELIPLVGTVNDSFSNYEISNYDELYKHSLEYWMENTFEYSGNQNYSIGFRFMWYLDETYGDYTKWITEYEKVSPYHMANIQGDQCPVEEQIKAFKLAYGENVFDGFYPWLKNNEALFQGQRPIDLSGAKKIEIYPMCASYGIVYNFSGGSYNDLYIDIDVGRNYLSEYKHKNTDGMTLTIDRGVVIELYDREGRLLRTEEATETPINLDGVSFIKLVGSGSFRELTISGFENYSSN